MVFRPQSNLLIHGRTLRGKNAPSDTAGEERTKTAHSCSAANRTAGEIGIRGLCTLVDHGSALKLVRVSKYFPASLDSSTAAKRQLYLRTEAKLKLFCRGKGRTWSSATSGYVAVNQPPPTPSLSCETKPSQTLHKSSNIRIHNMYTYAYLQIRPHEHALNASLCVTSRYLGINFI